MNHANSAVHLRHRSITVATACAVVLAACGGGGDGTVTPPAAVDLVLTGTAATGAAIAGAAVAAKCATGTGSATTAADGSFTVTITGGALPCVLRVTAGAVVLHSLATGSGASARANLTPVTELTMARFAGDLPATYYDAFTAASTPAATDAAAQAAVAAVIETLKAGGVDFSGGANVLTGALAAAHGTVAGDANDQRLDALQAALTTRGVTLAELTQGVARATPSASAGVRTTVASLPPELLLAAPAPNCPSLRSGKYRVIVNDDGGTVPATGVITLNAPALTLVNTVGLTEVLTPTGPCTYTDEDGGEVFINKAGVAIARVGGATTALHGAVFFPEQAHSVADLAGDYNALAFDRTTAGGLVHATSSGFTVDGVGKVTALTFCDDLRVCVPATAATLPSLTYSVNAAGGFNVTNTTAGYVDRAFVYRAGGGEVMVVELANPGHITFSTRNAAVTLPPLGRIQQSWNLFLSSIYTAPAAINLSKYTVTGVDVAAGTYARAAVVDFNTLSTRPETLEINSLRTGYSHRVGPVTVPISLGGTTTVAEFIALPMRGMDMSVLALPASNQFGVSLIESTSP